MPAASEANYQARSLSALATDIPGATALFRKYKLDFCCSGAVTLSEAASAKGLDADAIAAELAALTSTEMETPRETAALIAHIRTHYHDVHRRELPELIRLAKQVEAIHGARDDAPKGLAQLLQSMANELESHMQKEECVLFPMMEDGGSDFIRHPIAAMRTEHDEVGLELTQLEAFATTTPADACATWRALSTGLIKFADDLMLHIHLENNTLFPTFEANNDGARNGCG